MESEAPGEGERVGFSLKIPGGGRGFQEGFLERIGEFGGGAKYFFSWVKRPPSLEIVFWNQIPEKCITHIRV